jgi:hypothetical protein
MIRGMGLSSDLENKVRKYLEFVWQQEEQENPEVDTLLLGKLSSSLRDEIFDQTNVKFLRRITILTKIFSDETLLMLAKQMRKVRYSPEEWVYKVILIFLP